MEHPLLLSAAEAAQFDRGQAWLAGLAGIWSLAALALALVLHGGS